MINKRLLIKNLLAHNNENTFFDKKLKIDIGSKEGKGKLLKHICALANSNPNNNSFIVVGVKDEDNAIVGVDFFDDSKIQNLINTIDPVLAQEITSILMEDERYTLADWKRNNIFPKEKTDTVSQLVSETILTLRCFLIDQKVAYFQQQTLQIKRF